MSFIKQAILVAVTALVVSVILPNYFKPSYPVPEVYGTVEPGFEDVKAVFRENFEEGWDSREAGSAFAVYHEGKKVVDLWAGYADLEAKRLWKEDTMTIIYSTSKAIGAVCVAILADRGLVDFKKPVAVYWPEFAQKGKEKITVEQLLEHEAGLYIIGETLSLELLQNHEKMDKVLAESEPQWEPGTQHGYHGITIGPLVDAVVRRVDPKKRTIGQFFDQEVRKPFKLDVYLGVPLELDHRIGRCINVQASWSNIFYALRNVEYIRKSTFNYFLGGGKEGNKMFANCGDVCEFERMADPDNRKIEVASANGFATARGLAKLFGILANGGKVGNKTLLSQGAIDEYNNDRRGLTPDYVLSGYPIRWKYGMDVIPHPDKSGNIFGSPGAGGQFAYADPNNKLGYGFVSRYMSPMGMQLLDPRMKRLYDSVLEAVKNKKKSR